MVDYLLEEVFSQQPNEIQEGLLYTSILDRFTESLFQEVVGNSKQEISILPRLKHLNMFLIPLDEKQQWYRYHHLFQEFLKQQLLKKNLKIHLELHRRASNWFARNNYTIEAILHALSAKDLKCASILIDSIWKKLVVNAQLPNLIKIMDHFPKEGYANHPKLCLIYAYALSFEMGKWEKIEKLLKQSRKNISPESQEYPYFLVLQSKLLFRKGCYLETIKLASEAMSLMNEKSDSLFREMGLLLIGCGYLSKRNMKLAYRYILKALNLNQYTGNMSLYHIIIGVLINLLPNEGKLTQASEIGQEALKKIEEWQKEKGLAHLGATNEIHLGLVYIFLAQNKIDLAEMHVKAAVKSYEKIWGMENIGAYHYMISVEMARGKFEEAYSLLRKYENLVKVVSLPSWIYVIIVHYKVILARQSTNLEFLLEEIDREKFDSLSFEFINVIWYRIVKIHLYLWDKNFSKAISMAEELSQNPNIKYLENLNLSVLRSIAYHLNGDDKKALEILSKSLKKAQPENCINPFLYEGNIVYYLLKKLQTQEKNPFLEKIISIFEEKIETPILENSLLQKKEKEFIEPLKEREMDILLLICQRYTYKEIARRLYLSINTVKWYIKIIYQKLNVKNRKQAIQKAYQLEIFSSVKK